MKKKKLKIAELKVQSFITSVKGDSVYGGTGSLHTCPRCAPISQWCPTERICETDVPTVEKSCQLPCDTIAKC